MSAMLAHSFMEGVSNLLSAKHATSAVWRCCGSQRYSNSTPGACRSARASRTLLYKSASLGTPGASSNRKSARMMSSTSGSGNAAPQASSYGSKKSWSSSGASTLAPAPAVNVQTKAPVRSAFTAILILHVPVYAAAVVTVPARVALVLWRTNRRPFGVHVAQYYITVQLLCRVGRLGTKESARTRSAKGEPRPRGFI